MQLQITHKGVLYTADCRKCGATLHCHEWAHDDNNDRRDAMQSGALRCEVCCSGTADPDTFMDHGRKWYAGRYSAPGYLDCTDWHYETNLRRLQRELREIYGEDA